MSVWPGEIGSLELALSGDHDEGRLFVITTCYVDESGTHNSPCMAIGAIIANSKQSAQFESSWKDVLRTFGVEYFHSVELFNKRGQYRG